MSDLVPLTAEEQQRFRGEGYLLLEQVFPIVEVEALLEEVLELDRKAIERGAILREDYYHSASHKLIRIFRLSRAFDHLIDHPGYLGKLVALLGPYIQLMGAEIFVRGASERYITGFHTDLGPGLQRILPDDHNFFLQIKVQIFLTDLSEPDSGNFLLIRGSHRRWVEDSDQFCMIPSVNRYMDEHDRLPPGAIQVLAKPGDVLLFPHSLWHAVGPNRCGRTRHSITLRYGQLALRPLERFDPVLTDRARRLTLRQRRLLGDFGPEGASSPYRPLGQEELIFAGSSSESAPGDPP